MPNNYVLLERTELNADSASVTFANIPQTGYTDLKIVYSARTTTAARDDFFKVQLNGSSSNFSAKVLYGSGSGAASFSDTSGYVGAIDAANATANTFNNGEFYLPNYRSTNAKSFSVDTVQEDNQAQAFITMTAGLWNPGTQAAITSITFVPNSGSFVANSTFSLYGIAAFGTTPTVAPKASGGNIIDYDGTYWYHTFLTSGTFTPQVGLICDYLVVAGGGAGGQSNGGGGGGGAGGYRTSVGTSGGGGSAESPLTLTINIPYTVTIGAGGAKGTNVGGWGNSGNNSVFSTITSNGGGGGGGDAQVGADGGSGGGGGGTGAGGAGTTNQGRAGGSGITDNATYRSFGGGGGASTVGTNGGAANAGATGGNGVASLITGTSITRAGGGGGGQITGAAGGTGGGGAGGNRTTDGVNGTVNTGSGGGGNGRVSPVNANGSGGAGIVIIRYPAA